MINVIPLDLAREMDHAVDAVAQLSLEDPVFPAAHQRLLLAEQAWRDAGLADVLLTDSYRARFDEQQTSGGLLSLESTAPGKWCSHHSAHCEHGVGL